MLVGLASVACLGFGSALVFAGSDADASQIGARLSHIGIRLVSVNHAAGRTAATITVCSSGADFSTIQAAINHAADGDTITVCAGTYAEQVKFSDPLKDVTLLAASKAAVIKAPGSMGGSKAIVEVAGAKDITIQGFTISGPGGGPQDSIGYGVEIDNGGSATVDSNDILDIRDDPFAGYQNGWAIGAIGGSVTATSNVIKGYQKTGIKLSGDGTVDTITGNTVVGAGPTSTNGQNGIFISSGASATVSGNKVSENFYTGTNASVGGITVTGSGAVTIENNTLSGNQIDVWVNGIAQDVNVTLSGNTIHGGSYGIIVQGASGVRVLDNTTHGQTLDGFYIAANDNTFDGNKASGVTGDGHYDCADVSHGDGTEGTANTWTNNYGETAYPEGICSPAPPPTTSTTTTVETTTITVTQPATTVTVPAQTITQPVTVTETHPAATVTAPGVTTVVTVPAGQSTTTVTVPARTTTLPTSTETKTTVVTVTDPSHQVLLPPHVVKELVRVKSRVRTILKTVIRACQPTTGVGKG
jgi:parallel beta-helix repeat protein